MLLSLRSSAGAINLAYSLSGQSRDGLAIYTEDLTDSRFFAPWRLWRLVDIDFLVDVAMKCLHPLNLQALLNNAIPLLISLTNAEDGSGRFLSTHESPDQILEGLRATSLANSLQPESPGRRRLLRRWRHSSAGACSRGSRLGGFRRNVDNNNARAWLSTQRARSRVSTIGRIMSGGTEQSHTSNDRSSRRGLQQIHGHA